MRVRRKHAIPEHLYGLCDQYVEATNTHRRQERLARSALNRALELKATIEAALDDEFPESGWEGSYDFNPVTREMFDERMEAD